ncbi:MAG: STAS domain-containing protein [Ectothiorhodospiraceae bacterium]|nr:STAS domain-containing protein [Ectothiorhodospiraceae bacterium]
MALMRERGSNKTKGLCKLAIDKDMTIYTIDALKQGLSEELDIYNRFELNLANVEEIDSAGIQLLLALSSELMQKKKEFKLTSMSGVVAKLIKNYGISARFNTEDVA